MQNAEIMLLVTPVNFPTTYKFPVEVTGESIKGDVSIAL